MAYAVVVSALHEMETFMQSVQSHNLIILNSIHAQISSLLSFLEKFTPVICRSLGLDHVDQQIQDLAERIEDLIESHSDGLDSDGLSAFADKLLKVKQDIDSLNTTMIQTLSDKKLIELGDHTPTDEAVPLMLAKSGLKNSKLVGMDREIKRLLHLILRTDQRTIVVGITGMAGIGKTTFVQQVYDHPKISSLYKTRIMVRVGPYCQPRDLLLLVLAQLGFHENLNEDELKPLLSQVLRDHKRFLIVLDDVWSPKLHRVFRETLPDDCADRCRIIMTSRQLEVFSQFVGYDTHYHHQKEFLTDEDSWSLLRDMVFSTSEQSCSSELERVGRKIAKNCEGLPLAVISVADLLSKVAITLEYWTKVSEDENPLSIGVDSTTVIGKSVLLSYEMLDYKLQVFFLHLGVFPRHYEIFVADLIKLWLTEGFYRQQESDQTNPEHVVEDCFYFLMLKGVVLSSESSSDNYNVKKCRVHTVFRNLCIHMAENSKFCYVMRKFSYSFPHGTNRQHRLCIHNNVLLAIKDVQTTMESIPHVRSLLCFGQKQVYPLHVQLSFRLLRVLDALLIRFHEFPDHVMNLVRLRYFTITCHGQIPGSISRLENLQVLVLGRHHRIKSLTTPSYLPVEIWSLKWLRHLKCIGIDLPEPCTDNKGCSNSSCLVLEHLLTLSGVSDRSCRQEILKRLPNLKKLGVQIELGPDEEQSFSFLNDVAEHLCLEKLTCVVFGLRSEGVSAVPRIPKKLKKLTLSGCGFLWKDMKAISMLPELEMLKLRCRAFRGPVWSTCMSEFGQLKHLLLEDLEIKEWTASASVSESFPRLLRLFIRHCYRLKKVPEVAPNDKLRKIVVDDCSTCTVKWAKQIQGQFQKLRHDNLEVFVHQSWKDNDKKHKPWS